MCLWGGGMVGCVCVGGGGVCGWKTCEVKKVLDLKRGGQKCQTFKEGVKKCSPPIYHAWDYNQNAFVYLF